MVLASHSTEAAEYFAEGLGADALHQSGIATGEVLVDMGSTEQLRYFALSGQAVVTEEEFLYGTVATVVSSDNSVAPKILPYFLETRKNSYLCV